MSKDRRKLINLIWFLVFGQKSLKQWKRDNVWDHEQGVRFFIHNFIDPWVCYQGNRSLVHTQVNSFYERAKEGKIK